MIKNKDVIQPLYRYNMSDKEYQARFIELKKMTKPLHKRFSGRREYKSMGLEHYNRFIAGVLATIRQDGECDYVFREDHLVELLRHEHDRLRCRYLPDLECWMVWIRENKPVKIAA